MNSDSDLTTSDDYEAIRRDDRAEPAREDDRGLIGGVPHALTGSGPASQPIPTFAGNFAPDEDEYDEVERDDLRGVADQNAPDSFAGSGSTVPPSSPHEQAVLEAEDDERRS